MEINFLKTSGLKSVIIPFLLLFVISCRTHTDPGNWDVHWPIVEIEISSTAPSVDDTVKFEAKEKKGSSNIVNWEWNFGDSNTKSGNIVSHVFKEEGTYEVNLLGTDADGNEVTVKKSVVVSKDAGSLIRIMVISVRSEERRVGKECRQM